MLVQCMETWGGDSEQTTMYQFEKSVRYTGLLCLLAALLYGDETWTVYVVQADRLQAYVM